MVIVSCNEFSFLTGNMIYSENVKTLVIGDKNVLSGLQRIQTAIVEWYDKCNIRLKKKTALKSS